MVLHGRIRRRLATPAGRAQVAGTALALLAGVLAVPVMGSAGPTEAHAQPATTTACTRIIEGSEWVFDPCIPEGEPLPQDVLDQLEELRRERDCRSTTATTPPTTTSTWSPPPPTTTYPPTSSWPTYPTTTYPSYPSPPPPGVASVPSFPPSPTFTGTTAPPPTETTPTGTTVTGTTPPEPTTTWSEPSSTVTEPTTTTSWTCPPTTEPTTTPPTSTPPPTETTPPTDPLPPTEPPSDCPAEPSAAPAVPDGGTGIADEQEDKRRAAREDRIDCRNPNNIPDRGDATVLVATGDSVTSAHHQWGFGAGVCDRTSADFRRLTGNHAKFSYAGKYFDNLNPNVIEYYNFARTGFGTGDMLAAGAAKLDSCTNAWARPFAPVPLADAVIRKAKADGHKAFYVTTGGVNNTNWTDVLKQLVKCRGMEFMQNAIPRSSIAWNAIGGRAGIVTNGGGCTLRVRNVAIFGQDFFHRIGVPRYDGPAQAAGITRDVTNIVNTILAAGADKIVWMLYYDITPANVDLGNFGWTYVRSFAPAWVAGLLPPRIAPANQPLIDPMWVGAVRALVNNLNAAIVAGIPANRKVRAQAAPGFLAADIQNTAIGGSPHPSAAGQTKLSNTLNAAFNAI
ncbi:MAG TPA: hypothetical protein VGD67_22405 [Pseudonocardiaceae bacterium]